MVEIRGDGGGWSMNRSFSALSLLRAFYGTAIFVCAVVILRSHPTLAADLVDAQDAAISAGVNVVTMNRVPVIDATGTPNYFDVTIKLTATLLGGGPTVSGVKATATSRPSPHLVTNGFVPGTHNDENGNLYTVAGPSIGPGGATAWTLTLVTDKAGCAMIGGFWYTDQGPNNPEYGRVTAANITPPLYSFGLLQNSNGDCLAPFSANALIGLIEVGDTLTLESFTFGGDKSSPQASWILTLQ
jgi:hypothetical protein